GLRLQELRPVAVLAPDEVPHQQQRRENQHDRDAERAEQERPAADVLEVELLELFDERHFRASETRAWRFPPCSSSPAGARCEANRVNWAPGPALDPVWMTFSSGEVSASDASMLRMKAE